MTAYKIANLSGIGLVSIPKSSEKSKLYAKNKQGMLIPNPTMIAGSTKSIA